MAAAKKKIVKKTSTYTPNLSNKKTAPKALAKPKSKFIQELATTKDPAAKKGNHYVDNKQMYALIIERKEALKTAKKLKQPKPKIADILGKQLILIANNLSHKPGFNNYPCKDEMIGDAIENCIMYFDNFNPKKSKYPFAYFTKIIYYAFVRRIQKEKKSLYIKYKATQQAGILHEAETGGGGGGDDGGGQFEMYDNISEFIGKYEEAQERAKIKQNAKLPKKGLEKHMA